MNQSIAPAITTRASASADAPDILFILRRFAWLLAIGTLLGAGIATAYYYYCREKSPKYKSFVQFQVLPPPTPLGSGEGNPPLVLNTDDTNQFIHRQVLYIKQDRILQSIIRSKEFQTDYNHAEDTTRTSQWLRENSTRAIKQLKKDLQVTPLVDSAAFEISMTAGDPYEALQLVTAATNVYIESLKSDNKRVSAQRQEQLNKIRQDQERTVRDASNDLSTFQAQMGGNVPALTSRYKLEFEALQQATARKFEYASLRAAAAMQLESLKRMDETGSDSEFLKSEVEQFFNDDSQVRTLRYQRLNLEQEMAAVIAGGGMTATASRKRDIEARMDTVDKQMADIKTDLEKRARISLTQRAQNNLSNLDAQHKYISEQVEKKEGEVREMDIRLIQYQQKVEALKAQEEILAKLRRQDQLMMLTSGTDDTRVQRIVDPALPRPNDFVSPNMLIFLPLGTASGFGLSFLIAYLLVWTDTRVRTPRDITKTLQLPLLGFIPDESDDRSLKGDVATALLSSPHSMVAESFRQIRSQLSAQTENSPVNTLLVASVAPGGGSSTVASNLAAGMALNDRRVLLVDANFYRPSLGSIYKNIPAEGFSDALTNPAVLSSAIVASQDLPRLHLLGAGTQLGKASSELLETRYFRDLLEQLRSRYDLVIFDGAPLNLVADSLTLAARVDAVISVIRAGEVSRGTVTRIREQLRQVHANLLGFILNAAQTSNTGYFKENYRSFYRYAGHGARRSSASNAAQ